MSNRGDKGSKKWKEDRGSDSGGEKKKEKMIEDGKSIRNGIAEDDGRRL